MERCAWPGKDKLMIEYHDREWGVPCRDDKKLFEYMVLDTFQAGLSWQIILHKRRGFKNALANFNPSRISKFTSHDISRLTKDVNIIRNKQKILATITNAREFLKIQKDFGSFARYIWQFTDHKTITNKWKRNSQLQAQSKESVVMSKDLKTRGFKFVGPTICHAFMQGVGMINDHLLTCFRHKKV